MYQCIVVGVRDTPTSIEAAQHARELAMVHGAVLHLVAVYTVDWDGSRPEERPAQELLDGLSVPVLPAGIQTHVLPGDPGDVILRVATEVEADLIVVGNKGMHGLHRVLGSVPNKIAHHAPCAVLIVHTT
jgi:nucleotide-binding universal stress UspA family protein